MSEKSEVPAPVVVHYSVPGEPSGAQRELRQRSDTAFDLVAAWLLENEPYARIETISVSGAALDQVHPDEWLSFCAGVDSEFTCCIPQDWGKRGGWGDLFTQWVEEHQGCELLDVEKGPFGKVYARVPLGMWIPLDEAVAAAREAREAGTVFK